MAAGQSSEPSLTEVALEAAWQALPEYGDEGAARFPADNLIERLLVTNDYFGSGLMRVALKMLPSSLPESLGADADYWATNWKRINVTPAEKSRFLDAALNVDALLSGTSVGLIS